MKLLRFLLVVAASFGLVSCFEMKSSVVVNKDGSATVEETVLIGAQLAAMMAQGGGQGGPGEQLKAKASCSTKKARKSVRRTSARA